MAAYFQLFPKGSDEPATFQAIDDRMRSALGEPPDPDRYLAYWHSSIGLWLALGKTFDQCRTEHGGFINPSTLEARVLAFLEQNYTPYAWAGR